MVRKAFRYSLLVAAGVGFCLSGCGTAINLKPRSEYSPSDTGGRQFVYGGVGTDLVFATQFTTQGIVSLQPVFLLVGVGAVLDLPFSFIGDTFTLNQTIPATYRYLTKGEEPKPTEPAEQSPNEEGAAQPEEAMPASNPSPFNP